MKDFFYYLQRGQLRIPTCSKCHQKVWPPSQFCSQCFSRRIDMVKADRKGRILELSKSHNKDYTLEMTYALIEISGVRLIGSVIGNRIKANNSVLLRRCGLKQGKNAFYEFLMDTNKNSIESTKLRKPKNTGEIRRKRQRSVRIAQGK